MRRFAAAVGAALLLGPAAAYAGILNTATWLQVTQGVPMTRTTSHLGATGSSSFDSISVSLTYPQFTFSFFLPHTTMGVLDLHIKITQGGPQAITATPHMGAGSPLVAGTVVIMTAQHIAMGANRSMFTPGVNTLVAIPLGHGKASQVTRVFTVIGVTHHMTVDFFDWSPGTRIFTGLTSKGVALPDVVAMGSFDQVPHNTGGGIPVGAVTLVAPTRISIDGDLLQRRTVSLTTLELNFVPEPAALLLLGAGALALAFAGYGKAR